MKLYFKEDSSGALSHSPVKGLYLKSAKLMFGRSINNAITILERSKEYVKFYSPKPKNYIVSNTSLIHMLRSTDAKN